MQQEKYNLVSDMQQDTIWSVTVSQSVSDKLRQVSVAADGAHPYTQRSSLPILGDATCHPFADAKLVDVLDGFVCAPHHLQGLASSSRRFSQRNMFLPLIQHLQEGLPGWSS